MQLDQYQVEGIDNVARKIAQGMKRIVCQLATGGGKTVMFAGLCNRWLQKSQKDILILVHRDELLKQSRKTIYEWHGIISEPIVAGQKSINPARIYVAMVETANNRLKKNPNYFRNVGLVIIDEAHLGNFTKMLDLFGDAIILGYTATPKNTSKKVPMNKLYEDIVCCVDIPYLIELHDWNPERGLLPCVTYSAKNITQQEKAEWSTTMGEYANKEMTQTFTKSKHVHNTVLGYEKHALGKKTLIFNCSIEHSQIVNQAFLDAGYNSRHLDSDNCTEREREDTLSWFKNTPDAILNNIGILTTGFDEPSVEVIIINRSTKSLPLWLQMCGRGSRPFPGLKFFTIIDMGDNVITHMEWSEPRPWEYIFNNPDKPMPKAGVAPIKICVECEGIIAAQARVCKWCQALQPIPEPTYDDKVIEFVMVTKNTDIKKLVDENAGMRKINGDPVNKYHTLHRVKHDIINAFKAQFGAKKIDDATAYKLLAAYQDQVQDWCKLVGKNYNMWHKTEPSKWFQEELKNTFKWEPAVLQLAV